jgi:hypothetical protein
MFIPYAMPRVPESVYGVTAIGAQIDIPTQSKPQ